MQKDSWHVKLTVIAMSSDTRGANSPATLWIRGEKRGLHFSSSALSKINSKLLKCYFYEWMHEVLETVFHSLLITTSMNCADTLPKPQLAKIISKIITNVKLIRKGLKIQNNPSSQSFPSRTSVSQNHFKVLLPKLCGLSANANKTRWQNSVCRFALDRKWVSECWEAGGVLYVI